MEHVETIAIKDLNHRFLAMSNVLVVPRLLEVHVLVQSLTAMLCAAVEIVVDKHKSVDVPNAPVMATRVNSSKSAEMPFAAVMAHAAVTLSAALFILIPHVLVVMQFAADLLAHSVVRVQSIYCQVRGRDKAMFVVHAMVAPHRLIAAMAVLIL